MQCPMCRVFVLVISNSPNFFRICWPSARTFGFRISLLSLTLFLVPALLAPASIIGTNPPVSPLTSERIAKLPTRQRADWEQYLQRSDRQLHADQAFFRDEMRANGVSEPTNAPGGRSVRSMPLS